MNNKTNDSANEIGGYQWPAVFEYKADDALFVLCETEEDELYHIKLKFDSIVSILEQAVMGSVSLRPWKVSSLITQHWLILLRACRRASLRRFTGTRY